MKTKMQEENNGRTQWPCADIYCPKADYYITQGLDEESAREEARALALDGWDVDVRKGGKIVYKPYPLWTTSMMVSRTCAQIKSFFKVICPDEFEKIEFTVGKNGPTTGLHDFVNACAQADARGGRYLQDNPDDRAVLFDLVRIQIQIAFEGTEVCALNEFGEYIYAKLVEPEEASPPLEDTDSNDALEAWLDVVDVDRDIIGYTVSRVYKSYEEWASDNGIKPVCQSVLSKLLHQKLGVETMRISEDGRKVRRYVYSEQ